TPVHSHASPASLEPVHHHGRHQHADGSWHNDHDHAHEHAHDHGHTHAAYPQADHPLGPVTLNKKR
ncbi:MAG: sirohydrochlorin chelatase, partial [Notoacmeibacter sp.]